MPKKSKVKAPPNGVEFPITGTKAGKASRSTTTIGKRILGQAFHAVDEAASQALRDEKDNKWRYGYQKHVAKAVTTMASNAAAANTMAQAGLEAVANTMLFIRNGDESLSLAEAMVEGKFTGSFHTGCITGQGTMSSPADRSGADVPFLNQLSELVNMGNMEASCEQAVQNVLANPDWLDLRDITVVMLGVTSEMGPLEFLLERGATVVGVARPGAAKWSKILALATHSCGTLIFPMKEAARGVEQQAAVAGADCLTDTPELANWLTTVQPNASRLFMGCYIYLDGEKFVRASAAMDAIATAVCARRKAKYPSVPPLGLLYIETPSNFHAVHAHCKTISRNHLKRAPIWQKLLLMMGLLKPLQFTGDSTLMEVDGQPAVLMNGLIAVQGPNYSLAKLIQRWRIIRARSAGQLVSVNVGPATATNSVMHVPTVAMALENCHLFAPQLLFQPDIVKRVLSLLLISDIQDRKSFAHPSTPISNPLALIPHQAWHGGIWTTAYTADSMGVIQFLVGFCKKNAVLLLSALMVVAFLVNYFLF